MNKQSVLSNLIIRVLLALTVAGAVFLVLGRSAAVHADPIPRMSDRQFRDALTDMTAEYDKAVSQRQAERNPYISERLIVKSSDRKLDPEDYGAVDAIQDRQGNYILQFESVQDAKRAAHDLSLKDSTVYVEPDGYLYACDFSQTLDETRWGYSAGEIGADRYAEAISGISGSVEVAVLDTGISFTSPKLSMRLDTVHAKSFSTEEGRELNPDQSKESSTTEKAKHGTHVAGIVAQCTEGLTNIRILPVRVLDNSGLGNVSQVAEGIRYAAEQGAEVINLSLSGKLEKESATIKAAVDYANDLGSTVVVVAGNDGQNIAAYTPGNLEECIVVGSVGNNKNDYTRYPTSNYGNTVDVVAPGVDIYSTSWENASDGYTTLTGTSMAAPHAAAAAAMIKLAYSDYSPEKIEQLLKQHVRDLGEAGKDDYYGYGMINLAQPADEVMALIDALHSPVSLDDKSQIASAREAYDALSEIQKSLVANLDVLEAAEKRIPKLEEAQAAAESVIAQIGALPETITLNDKAAVEEARSAYEALTDDQKSMVTNLSALEAAEAKVQELISAAEDKEKAQKKYARSDPKPNVTYRVPLKKKQKTKVLRVIGLADGDKVVSWKSSNKKKAKVTGKPDGTCQIKAGKKTGKVRITAVTASGRKVVFKLRIQSSKVKTKKIRIAKRTVRISVGETLALKPKRYPITSVQKITYKSRNKSVAAVSKKGVIKGIAAGETKIVISSGDRKIKVKVIVS